MLLENETAHTLPGILWRLSHKNPCFDKMERITAMFVLAMLRPSLQNGGQYLSDAMLTRVG